MSISLKVIINSSAKTMRFNKGMTVDEMIKNIIEKTTIGTNEFGIFQQARSGENARWLANEKTLAFYGLKDGVCFFFLMFLNLNYNFSSLNKKG